MRLFLSILVIAACLGCRTYPDGDEPYEVDPKTNKKLRPRKEVCEARGGTWAREKCIFPEPRDSSES